MKKNLLRFLFSSIFLLAAVVGFSSENDAPKIREVSESTFEKEIKDDIVIVDFWATWCYPCKIQGRILENMLPKLPKGVKIIKIDTDANPQLSSVYNIRSIPTLLIFKNGSVAKRYVGVQQEENLLKILNELKNE